MHLIAVLWILLSMIVSHHNLIVLFANLFLRFIGIKYLLQLTIILSLDGCNHVSIQSVTIANL